MKMKRLFAMAMGALLAVTWVSPASAHSTTVSSTVTAVFAVIITLGITISTSIMLHIKLKPIQYVIINLTLLTALIHLFQGLGVQSVLDILLLLSGITFFVLLGAMYLPLDLPVRLHQHLHWMLIGHTLLNIIAFFIVHPWGVYMGTIEWLGLTTKAIECALIGALIVDKLILQRHQMPPMPVSKIVAD
jgi:hypothetical protein